MEAVDASTSPTLPLESEFEPSFGLPSSFRSHPISASLKGTNLSATKPFVIISASCFVVSNLVDVDLTIWILRSTHMLIKEVELYSKELALWCYLEKYCNSQCTIVVFKHI